MILVFFKRITLTLHLTYVKYSCANRVKKEQRGAFGSKGEMIEIKGRKGEEKEEIVGLEERAERKGKDSWREMKQGECEYEKGEIGALC